MNYQTNHASFQKLSPRDLQDEISTIASQIYQSQFILAVVAHPKLRLVTDCTQSAQFIALLSNPHDQVEDFTMMNSTAHRFL